MPCTVLRIVGYIFLLCYADHGSGGGVIDKLIKFLICLSLPIYKDIAIGECIGVFSKSVIHPSDIIPHPRILDSYEQQILNRLCRKTKLNLSIETNSGLYMMSVRSWEMILPKSNKQSIKTIKSSH